jgi:hypothetical protein
MKAVDMTWAMMPEQSLNDQVRYQYCFDYNDTQYYATQHFLDRQNPTQSELQSLIYSRQSISYGLAAPNNGDYKKTPIYENIYKEPMWENGELTILWEDDPKLNLLKYQMKFKANFISIDAMPKERLRTKKPDPNFPSIVNFLCNPLEKPEKNSSHDIRYPLQFRLLPVVYWAGKNVGETPPEMANIINKYGAAFLIRNLPYNPGSYGNLVRPLTEITVKVKLYSDIKNLTPYPPLPPSSSDQQLPPVSPIPTPVILVPAYTTWPINWSIDCRIFEELTGVKKGTYGCPNPFNSNWCYPCLGNPAACSFKSNNIKLNCLKNSKPLYPDFPWVLNVFQGSDLIIGFGQMNQTSLLSNKKVALIYTKDTPKAIGGSCFDTFDTVRNGDIISFCKKYNIEHVAYLDKIESCKINNKILGYRVNARIEKISTTSSQPPKLTARGK